LGEPHSANRVADISLRQAAIIAGLGYIPIFVLGLFANIFSFIAPGDAAATANNIVAAEMQFRLSIVIWVVLMTIDTVVAWALYVLLKPVNKSLSLLTGWFRLVFVGIFASSLVYLLSVLQLLSGADYLSVFEPGQLQAQALLFLNAYAFGVNVSWVFFGLHIFFLGYLIFKSSYGGYIPRILGVLLMVASFGYFIDSFASFLSPSYANNEALFILVVGLPAITSELSLTIWLFVKGGKIPEIKPGN